jgi:hypothetical protein
LFMIDIVVDKKDYVPLWASFWTDPKKNSVHPPPSPSTVKKRKRKSRCTLCLVFVVRFPQQ